MGFKSLIAKQVQGAMRTLGTDADGLARKRVFLSMSEGVYNSAARTVEAVETRHVGVPMVLSRFSLNDIDDEVRPQTDRVVLIASLDLPVAPDENDKIEDTDLVIYTVKRILSDPADAMYKIHVRRE
jgi:hypothetical protein